MSVDISIAKRGRTCNYCSRKITKDTRFFLMKTMISQLAYPISKNICFDCAGSLADPLFILEMENMVKHLKQLKLKQDSFHKRNREVAF